MPIYEFGCQECNAHFEKFVRSFNAINTVSCPDCGSEQVEKQVSVFANRVQGSAATTSAPAASCAPGGL